MRRIDAGYSGAQKCYIFSCASFEPHGFQCCSEHSIFRSLSSLSHVTSPNLLGIVLLSLGWLNFGVVVTLSEFKYLMSVNEVLQIIKCPINNINSQFLTLLHFI